MLLNPKARQFPSQSTNLALRAARIHQNPKDSCKKLSEIIEEGSRKESFQSINNSDDSESVQMISRKSRRIQKNHQESSRIVENRWESLRIVENRWESLRIIENPSIFRVTLRLGVIQYSKRRTDSKVNKRHSFPSVPIDRIQILSQERWTRGSRLIGGKFVQILEPFIAIRKKEERKRTRKGDRERKGGETRKNQKETGRELIEFDRIFPYGRNSSAIRKNSICNIPGEISSRYG